MVELLPDSPAETDQLGFTPMVEILVNVVRATPPPFTIGIFGPWGSGKTTLMDLMRRALEAQGTKTVWFNAWKYDGKEVIWNALIQSIFYRMKEEPPTGADPSFVSRVTEVAGNLALFAAKKAAPLIPGGFVKGEDVDTVVKAFKPLSATDKQFDFINKFEATFDKLVKEFVGANGRLVVFVDDLDRCLPESAIEVLEAIKLYLDRGQVTFIVGAERAIVEEGIRQRYKDNQNLSAKEYLEKIVQLPFVMRGLSSQAAISLIRRFEEAAQYQSDQTMHDLILDGTGSNPRRIKRFVNTFYVLTRMAELAGRKPQGQEAHRLAVVLLLQMRAPDIYEALIRRPGLLAEFVTHAKLGSDDREREQGRNPTLKRMYGDEWLRPFLEGAATAGLDAAAIRHWLLLAEGTHTDGAG